MSSNQHLFRHAKPGLPRRSAGQTAFTLMEVLLSVGILGIGMLMAGTLFPAALKVNQSSVKNVLGTMICQNGIEIIKAKLTFPLKDSAGVAIGTAGLAEPAGLSADDMRYPTQDANSTYGFRVLARHMPAANNDYQLLLVAYQTSPARGAVSLTSITRNGGGNLVPPCEANIVAASAALPISSVLIEPTTGLSSRIVGVDDTGRSGILSAPFIDESGATNYFGGKDANFPTASNLGVYDFTKTWGYASNYTTQNHIWQGYFVRIMGGSYGAPKGISDSTRVRLYTTGFSATLPEYTPYIISHGVTTAYIMSEAGSPVSPAMFTFSARVSFK